MDLPLWSGLVLVDLGFRAYWHLGEVPSIKVKEFVTYFVVKCNYQAVFAVDKCVAYTNGSATYIAVDLEVEGGNILSCA